MSRRLSWFVIVALGSIACSGSNFSSNSGSGLGDGGPPTDANSSAGGTTSGTGGASSVSGGSQGTGGGAVATGGGINAGGAVATGGGSNAGGTAGAGGGIASDASTEGGVVGSDAGNPCSPFPTFEKGCGSDSNCVLVNHVTSCCGSILRMAINHAEVTRFAAAEAACSASYPLCGCFSNTVTAEDGTSVTTDTQDLIIAKCDNGTCQSRYSGNTFPCGTGRCTDQQYCSVFVSGVPGGGSSYNCVSFDNGCTDCGCIQGAGSCSCSNSGGGVTVTCSGA